MYLIVAMYWGGRLVGIEEGGGGGGECCTLYRTGNTAVFMILSCSTFLSSTGPNTIGRDFRSVAAVIAEAPLSSSNIWFERIP